MDSNSQPIYRPTHYTAEVVVAARTSQYYHSNVSVPVSHLGIIRLNLRYLNVMHGLPWQYSSLHIIVS